MSRVELAGLGGPIPTVALTDPNLDENLAPQAFLLTTGNFLKADWVGLGYTHYEVMCIGAAGGNGSDGGGDMTWPYYYSGYDSSGRLIMHWYDPHIGSPNIFGGGGGGGGLHRVAGSLADLPDVTPVVVGVAGAQGPRGDSAHQNPYMPTPPGGGVAYWDLPHLMIQPPTVGQDGGASSFGDVCVASGGKGGFPATVWDVTRPSSGYNFPGEIGGPKPDGRGGQGGKGGQSVAGGGGAGAFFTLSIGTYGEQVRQVTPAKDGIWNGVVGEGGGGGLGGEYIPGWRFDYSAPSGAFTASRKLAPDELMHGLYDDTIVEATSGGKGSFSYSDTSVYGQRQDRQFSYYEASAPRSTMEKVSPLQFIYTPTPYLIVPGCGGGARINKSQGFGSRAPGFSPDGAVLIRVTKID
jgi:hypothetical protein